MNLMLQFKNWLKKNTMEKQKSNSEKIQTDNDKHLKLSSHKTISNIKNTAQ